MSDKKKKTLREEIEVEIYQKTDSIDIAPETFVGPLIQEISKSISRPEVDLSTKESAAASLKTLTQKLHIISQERDRIAKLKTVLENE